MSSFVGGTGRPRIQLNVKFATPKGDPLDQMLKIFDRLQDLKPILEKIPEAVIFPSVQKSFASEGRPGWRFKGYQSSPPMIKTGLMKRGLTTRDPGLNTIRIDKDTLVFELNPGPYIAASRRKGSRSPGVFYPSIHQFGGSRHYQNIVLNIQEEDIDKIEQMVNDYVAEGKL